MLNDKKKIIVYFTYTLIVFFIFGFLIWIGHSDVVHKFVTKMSPIRKGFAK